MSKIIPIHYDFTDCFEDQVASILKLYDFDFTRSCYESWNFEYLEANLERSIGQRISSATDRLGLLSKLSLIDIKVHNIGITDLAIKTINFYLEKGIPVIAIIRSSQCPWDVNYNTHLIENHAIILESFNFINDNYTCCDAWLELSNLCLTKSQLEIAFNNKFFIIDYKNTVALEQNDELFIRSVEALFANNVFEKMHSFANSILNLDPKKEYDLESSDPSHSKIIRELYNIVQDRKAVYQYMRNHILDIRIKCVAESMVELSAKWQIIRGLLIKVFYYKNDLNRILQKVSLRINEVAEQEKNLALYILGNDKQLSKPVISYEVSIKENIQQIDKFNHVDLDEFVNAEKIDGRDIFVPEVNIYGEYKTDMYSIFVPELSSECNKHIICRSQIIPAKCDDAICLVVMGACDWGDYSDEITVFDKDGGSENVTLSLPDWCNLKGEYWDCIIGSPGFYEYDTLTVKNSITKLFVQKLFFSTKRDIIALGIPDCINMHIFAVSVGVAKVS